MISFLLTPFSIIKIAWKNVLHRRFAAIMTMFSMALGVMLIVTVLTMFGVVSDSFRANSSLGYDMLVGAKGGKLQLTLNSVFYLSQPIETIPYEYYLEFYGSDVRQKELKKSIAYHAHEASWKDLELSNGLVAGPAGMMNDVLMSTLENESLGELKIEPEKWNRSRSKFNGRFDSLADLAIPINLGDYFHEYRVVATLPSFFDELVVSYESKQVRSWGRVKQLFVSDEWEDYRWDNAIDAMLSQEASFEESTFSKKNKEFLQKLKKQGVADELLEATRDFVLDEESGGTENIEEFVAGLEEWEAVFEAFGSIESAKSFVNEMTNNSDWERILERGRYAKAVLDSEEFNNYVDLIEEADAPLKGRDKQIILARLFSSDAYESLATDFFANLDYTFWMELEVPFKFADGRAFVYNHPENGFYECVIGSIAAKAKNVKVGDFINPRHGAPDGHDHDQGFKVVGILESTGTPNDRAVFANLEGFYLMEDHAKPLGDEGVVEMEKDDPLRGKVITEEALLKEPLPIEQREVTAILVRSESDTGLGAMLMETPINEGLLRSSLNWSPYQPSKNVKQDAAQAVNPTQEIVVLLEMFVKPIQYALLFLTAMICVVSGISILVSIYNSMSERRHEIAVMRSLGASRTVVLAIILCESIIIAMFGGLLGWIGGHSLNAAISPYVEANTGVRLSFFEFAPSSPMFPDTLWGFDFPNEILESVSPELLLIPGLIVLAILVGLYPAISAYFTDVSKSLGK